MHEGGGGVVENSKHTDQEYDDKKNTWLMVLLLKLAPARVAMLYPRNREKKDYIRRKEEELKKSHIQR
jgi:hypothetical protein